MTFLATSAEDEAALELAPLDSSFFLATLRSRGVIGTARVGSFMANGLADFFAYMAEHWRGWDGIRTWGSLEGELKMTARSDRLGHVFLDVTLREGAPEKWTLRASLVLEAGMLDQVAKRAREFELANARAA